MLNTFLTEAGAIIMDAGATLSLLAGVAAEWAGRVPSWAVLIAVPLVAGVSLPILQALRARRSAAERLERATRARRAWEARARTLALATASAPPPATLARELVRQGLPAVEVPHRARLSLDAVLLLMRARPGRDDRQVRPGAAPLADPVPAATPGRWSTATA
jgi:hypothetical protein